MGLILYKRTLGFVPLPNLRKQNYGSRETLKQVQGDRWHSHPAGCHCERKRGNPVCDKRQDCFVAALLAKTYFFLLPTHLF